MLYRIQKIQEHLKQKNCEGIFVTNPKNIFYLTGFIGISPTERESSLLITQERALLFIPAMYEERALSQTHDIELVVDHERHGLLTAFTKYIQEKNRIMVEANNLTLAEFEKIKSLTSAKLQPENFFVENLRIQKENEEIEFLKCACEITDQTFNTLVQILHNTDYTSLAEHDITDAMRSISRELGAGGFGFDPIIASGAGSAEPHYFTSSKKLVKDTPLLLDFGFHFNGYTADLSRTLYLGSAPSEFKKMYSWVEECNAMCIQACKSGMTTQSLHLRSHDFFKEKNVEKHYLHSLGHGVGLDVHEAPGVGMNNPTVLKENMAITIEPGLYFTDKFGIRIEDVVLVTQTGCEVLSSRSPKNLIEIR